MAAVRNQHERYVVISADCHAGANLRDYLPYLGRRWHDDFERWAAAYDDPWTELDAGVDGFKIGVASGATTVNWDSDERLSALADDGIAAEVVFPNTAPPFYPMGVFAAPAPTSNEEYERRWAGLRAHNRWLVDFCAAAGGRRAGVAQILLYDVADAVREIHWAARAGITGGVLLPPDTQEHLLSLYYSRYDPIWEACEETGLPVHRHASVQGDTRSADAGPAGTAIVLTESRFFAHRCLAHLIFGGVFERHPRLRVVFTETGADWVPEHLAKLDTICRTAKTRGSVEHTFAGAATASLSRLPSQVFAEQCWVGASFMTAPEAARRHDIGVDRIMWGSDFPHSEGTYPYSREALRSAFAAVPSDEATRMLGANAAGVYGFDLASLDRVAATIGPTVEEVARPLEVAPSYPTETTSPVFADVSVLRPDAAT